MKEIPLGLSYDDVLIVPKFSSVATRSSVNTRTWLTKNIQLKIPIVSSNMDTVTEAPMAIAMAELGGIGFIHRNMAPESQAQEVTIVKKANSDYLVGAAVGVGGDTEKRVHLLVEAGVDVLLVDIAHGHSSNAMSTLSAIKKNYDIDVIAGNVATSDGVEYLIDHGADAVKVGIGPGSACTTRIMTGVGIPQLTAVMECAEAARYTGIPIMADGGVRNSGDLAKALGAGAFTAMLGNVLAGTDETPGPVLGGTERYKSYRGMASTEACGREHAEGVSSNVPYKGPVDAVIQKMLGGLRSAMSYVGSSGMETFIGRVDFVRQTQAGIIESAPHDLGVK